MDSPLLPDPGCERGRPGSGLPFSVRSASSPSYSLPCRQREREREGGGGGGEREGEDAGSRGEEAQKEAAVNARDNAAAEANAGVLPAQRSHPPGHASEAGAERSRGGGAERTRPAPPARSNSVDRRGGGAGSDEGRRTGVLAFSGNVGGGALKRTESLERRGAADGGSSRFNACNSAGAAEVERRAALGRVVLVVERASRGTSLPSRLRSQSGSESGSGSGSGPKTQSIWERIEKLYGSDKAEDPARTKRNSAPVGDWPLADGEWQGAASYRKRSVADSPFASPSSSSSSPSSVFSPPSSSPSSVFSPPLGQGRGTPTEGGAGRATFPRRLSRNGPDGGGQRPAPPSDGEPDACPPAGPSGCPWSGSRAPAGVQPERQAQGRQPEPGENTQGRGALDYCTRSLDRSRSRFTVAAQTRPSGAADTLSHAALADDASTPARGPPPPPPPGEREERWRDRRNKEATNDEERRGGMSDGKAGSSVHKMERVQELEKKSDFEGAKEEKKEREAKPAAAPSGVGAGSKLTPTNQMNGREAVDASARGAAASVRRGSSREGSVGEDVFESGPERSGAKRMTVPEKPAVASAASVRNKIHQFEALTQRAQGPPHPGSFLKTRRAFSVPEHLGRLGEGVKKSGSDKTLGGLRDRWERVKEGEGEGGNVRGEETRGAGVGVKKSASEKALSGLRSGGREEKMKDRGWAMMGSASAARGGGGDSELGVRRYSKDKMEIPLNGGIERGRVLRDSSVDRTDSAGAPKPGKTPAGPTSVASSSGLSNSNNDPNGEFRAAEVSGVRGRPCFDLLSPGSDDDRTPTNTPEDSPFHPREDAALAGGGRQRDEGCSPVSVRTAQAQTSTRVSDSVPGKDSVDLPLPLTSSSPSGLPQLRGEDTGVNLDVWVASLNQKIEQWNRGEEEEEDEGTEKDDDSNYDSDESSMTITSNMSQSDRRSFCLSLADLCNFGGVDYESEAESEDWSTSGRSVSLSSDASALSCVSVLGSEELDRLLDDVKGLGDEALQNYEDVQVVVLHKEVGAGLGFTMAGGVDQNKPVTVHKVFPSGVAAQEGSIREGDQVLSINGTALCGSAHWEALRTLRRARSVGMGVVVLRRGGAAQPCKGGAGTDPKGQKQTPPTNTGQRVCVRLEKRSRDLGFSLEGGLGSSLGDRPLSIQKIFLGGPVSQVCPGDELLEIQGVCVVGMMRLEAWTLIRRLPPGPVEVTLHRPAPPQSTS